MLRLISMNLYDMEADSRLENLAAFKQVYGHALGAVTGCLEKLFPSMTEEDKEGFLCAFFPFLFGVYPYTSHTDKQKAARKSRQAPYD